MRRMALAAIAILAILAWGLSLIDIDSATDQLAASLLLPPADENLAAFEAVTAPREWRFPADFGPHPRFRSEWWYYTGNLAAADGRRFGYQFTLFRRATSPVPPASASEWRSNQVYMGHFTITDLAAGRFLHEQRFSRAAAGLAGATAAPRLHIWLEDLDMQALNDDASRIRLRAAMPGAAIDFTLQRSKSPVLRGDSGYNRKGSAPDHASYYYSIPRLATSGTLTLGTERIALHGDSWMDHEFFTRLMPPDVLGWDWFALILDDGRELSLGWLRLRDGGRRHYGYEGSVALLIEPDGSVRHIAPHALHIEATGAWTSPHSNATYPSGWRLRIDDEQPLDLAFQPLLPDQELHSSDIVYWEGALRVTGDVAGYGYAELTGYHNSAAGVFPLADL